MLEKPISLVTFLATSSGSSMGQGIFRDLALAQITSPQSATASSNESTIVADSKMSTAEAARPTATPLGKSFGSTSVN